MRVLRALLGALLWLIAALVGLVGLILCVTVVLLPVGIPLLMLARRLLQRAIWLFLPPGAAHPLKTSKKSTEKAAHKVGDRLSGLADLGDGKGRKRLKKTGKKALKKLADA